MNQMNFDGAYYDSLYFADSRGKEYRRPNGSIDYWGYRNLEGYWDGCYTIAKAWKEIFVLERCDTDTGLCKACDIGCGRGPFVWALRKFGIEAWGFDFSQWAIDNKYKGCEDGWIITHDATKGFPYGNKSFDLVMALDFYEHIYSDDLDFVIGEMYRVSKRWIFLQISTTSNTEKGYILKKCEVVPIELEVNTVAGHVTVQQKEFWINKLNGNMNNNNQFKYRDDLVQRFIELVPENVIANWTKNAIIVMERV